MRENLPKVVKAEELDAPVAISDTYLIDLFPEISTRLKHALKRSGIHTLRDILSIDVVRFSRLPAVGVRTIEELIRLKIAIPGMLSSFESRQIAMIPTEAASAQLVIRIPVDISSHESFWEASRHAFEEFCTYLKPRDADVAFNRIWPLDGKIKTLDVLGKQHNCSRQSVRNIESSLLNLFAKLFCYNKAVKIKKQQLEIKLIDSIGGRWQAVTETIINRDELDPLEFVETLSRNWQIASVDLVNILEFAANLYSQTVSSGLSAVCKKSGLNIIALANLPDDILDTRISSLRLGRMTDSLENDYGVVSLRDICENHSVLPQRHIDCLDRIVGVLHASLDETKTMRWDVFCRLQQYPQYESVDDPSNVRGCDFLEKMRFLVSHVTSWSHARTVFDERIAKVTEERITQQMLAIQLLGDTAVAPQIARIEKHLIEKLSAVLVRQDFRACRCFVDAQLLEFFCLAQRLRAGVHSFEEFQVVITTELNRLGINENGIPHMIWAIVDGSAPNRYHHLSRRRRKSVGHLKSGSSGKIKLKGFKNIF